MAEAGVPGTGIVDGKADRRAEPLQLAPQAHVVIDLHVLGDLEDDRPGDAGEDRTQRSGLDQFRRRIEAEIAVWRKAPARLDRRVKAGGLQVDPEARPRGNVEDDVRCRRDRGARRKELRARPRVDVLIRAAAVPR